MDNLKKNIKKLRRLKKSKMYKEAYKKWVEIYAPSLLKNNIKE